MGTPSPPKPDPDPDLEGDPSLEPETFLSALRRRVRRRPARPFQLEGIEQIEFFDGGERGELAVSVREPVLSGGEDPWPEVRAAAAQLMDPRLQRIITAAANGWVVLRLKPKPE